MTTLYGINNCDTIKKTRALLTELGVDYVFHDYKKLGCDEALAKKFLKHFDYTELINTRGTTWRKLDDDTKSTMDKDRAIALIQEQPSIIKRPIIEVKNQNIVNFLILIFSF